ncbi:KilA-N domain-containing protein [Polaribacter sp. IC073]|uniref:KilA-N domain-containing protein n=1 Tax=Polaribacter sp. IC073 TaxID=2508540 RepID=UPI0011BE86D2|nr:KilA-N domain-containing protein [Polaribacter sp. IC073]TXD45761.1 KilA-N domain-containing protein [Polaribacter sp. IC073]
MAKRNKIVVDGTTINISSSDEQDYISLTDMVSNQEEGSKLIEKWLTNKNTIEFLGIWEQLNSSDFNSPEFGGIMNEAGTNRFYMSVKQWVNRTNAKGIKATSGRYGGTYAHKDIAFNFGLYISPMFNLVLIKEFQRLKEIESNKYGLEWNVKRILSKANYQVQTNAIKKYIVPKAKYSKAKEYILYTDEADLLNIVLFGCTAKDWRELNPTRVLNGENIRDMASINELAILSNIESLNSTLIKNNLTKKHRFKILSETVKEQRETLDKIDFITALKKENNSTFIDAKKKLK